MHSFSFRPATHSDKPRILEWLDQDYIKKWLHGQGLQNTFNGLESFFRGESSTTYWIGSINDFPFAFLITAPEGAKAISLDLFICEEAFLGKGLAVPMIQTFLFTYFFDKEKVFIDPEATNTRAIHVYKKAGFKIVGEFIAFWHPVPHYKMELEMKMGSYGIIPLKKTANGWTIFLIQHRGFEAYWTCPKGGVEAGETPQEAACRELKEETNLHVRRFLQQEPILEEFYWHHQGEKKFKRILFFVAEVEGEIALQSEEISHGEWFTLTDATSKIIHPEGKTTLKKVEKILKLF